MTLARARPEQVALAAVFAGSVIGRDLWARDRAVILGRVAGG